MNKQAKLWLEQAYADLKSAAHAFDAADYYVASFLSQQTVEKALKAALIEKNDELIKIHNLVILAKKLDLPESLIIKCD